MRTITVFALLATLLVLGSITGQIWAAEKVKISIPVRTAPHYALPMLADEEKGFSKKEGLEAEWVTFKSGGAQVQGLAAGAVDVAITSYTSAVIMAARGIPAMLVADLKFRQPWKLWVLTKSRIKTSADLKNAKIAVTRTGSLTHIYGRLAARAWGVGGSVRFVATGGVPQALAALKANTVDSLVMSFMPMANLIFGGEVRGAADITQYLPKGQTDVTVIVKREYAKSQPQTVKKVIKGISGAAQYAVNNRRWAIDKLTKISRYTPKAAEGALKVLTFSTDLTVSEQAVRETRKLLITYKLIKPAEAPKIKELYSNAYLP